MNDVPPVVGHAVPGRARVFAQVSLQDVADPQLCAVIEHLKKFIQDTTSGKSSEWAFI